MRQAGTQTGLREPDVVGDHVPAGGASKRGDLVIRRRLAEHGSNLDDVCTQVAEQDGHGAWNVVVDESHAPLPGSTRVRAGRLDVRRSKIRIFIDDASFVPALLQKADHGLGSDARTREDRLTAEYSPSPFDRAFAATPTKFGDVKLQRASNLPKRHGELEHDLAGRSRGFVMASRPEVYNLVVGQEREPDFGERGIEVQCRLESPQRLERQPIAKLRRNAQLDEVTKAV